MARLTPLAKGLVAVIILGGAGALSWNFGLKDVVTSVRTGVSDAASSKQEAQTGQKPNAAQPKRN